MQVACLKAKGPTAYQPGATPQETVTQKWKRAEGLGNLEPGALPQAGMESRLWRRREIAPAAGIVEISLGVTPN